MRVTIPANDQLAITEAGGPGLARRKSAVVSETVPSQFLQSEHVSVETILEVSAAPSLPARRTEAPPLIAFDVEAEREEAALAILRYPSGALSFHPGLERAGPHRKPTSRLFQFRIPLRQGPITAGRRDFLTQAIKAAVLRVAKLVLDPVAQATLPRLARLWEEDAWKKKGLAEGWFRVSVAGDQRALQLTPAVPNSRQRSLLFLHGTFCDAASAYRDLVPSGFFNRIPATYGDRIFAYNHFTVSRTPHENAHDLLSQLPDRRQVFDVITHSRGGLVLRTLVEQAAEFGALSQRFELGRAVLVASPNGGTPLVTPDRWETVVGWIANLVEIVDKFMPANPLSTAADFVSEAIAWLAHHITGDLPGLRSMDASGETIAQLQGPPGPPAHAYSALVANYHPDQALWQRLVDAGIDQFFGSANDLVVPAEGGWRLGREGNGTVDAERIGCFGPGGNLLAGESSPVIHTNFFAHQETATFLERALANQMQQLPRLNPELPLPDHRFVHGRRRDATTAVTASVEDAGDAGNRSTDGPRIGFAPTSIAAANTFHLVVMKMPEPAGSARNGSEEQLAMLYATYGGARVVERFGLRGDEAGRRFQQIIRYHKQIKNYTDRQIGQLPSDRDLIQFGGSLFDTLFQGEVKRLYDTARSIQKGHKLDLVFTSMIPWVAEKPWEFSFDPARQSFLATEEIHFVRNVMTSVPGDQIEPKPGPLRILVVSAQPVGYGQLSIEEETEVIRRGFVSLVNGGLAQIEILPRATISAVHGYLSTGKYNVLHFIGHGAFDQNTQQGTLVFEDERGIASPLDERSARELLCGRGLDLVFLNACQTSTASPSDFNKGMAQALVAHGIPALVANQYSVLDVSATSFAQFFYWGLAHGMTLGMAAREARIAVNYSLQGDVIDWAIPVLYARDPNSRLTPETATPGTVSVIAKLGEERRGADKGSRIRVALWDVDHALPGLRQTAAKLNEAQTRFVFEIANLTPPLDSFDIHQERGTQLAYLNPERVAARLQSKVSQMKVDYLLCITAHPMEIGKQKLHQWYGNTKPTNGVLSPVLIFSYSGMETEFNPSGPKTDRVLANAIVSLLAGARIALERHSAEPESCPMHLRTMESAAGITRELRFDARCMAILRSSAPQDTAALTAMLRRFDAAGSARRPTVSAVKSRRSGKVT
jgi:hypothetical protein